MKTVDSLSSSVRSNDGSSSSGRISRGDHSARSGLSGPSTHSTSQVTSYSAYENSSQPSSDPSKESYDNPVVASKEQRAVFLARLVVVAVLVIALAIVASIMYWLVSRNERMEFETQFDNFASEITSLVQDNCKSAIDSAESFSTMITSSAIETGKSWPFVSITDFTSKAKRLSTLSGAYQIGFAPIVYPDDFSGWTTHSFLNLRTYYEEALKVHGNDNLNGYDTTLEELLNKTLPFPWRYNQTNALAGPYPIDSSDPTIPIQLKGLRERIGFRGFWINWQSLTWLEPLYSFFQKQLMPTNLDLLISGFEDAFATAYEFNIPAFDSYRNPIIDPISQQLLGWEIQTQMVQPIFDTIYNGNGSRKELRMVGALNMLFDWRKLLSNLLSKADIRDVEIVLSNTCSLLARPVTFRITNDEVVEVGPEDLHDLNYDDMGFISPLFELDLDEETQSEINKVMAQEIEATVEGGCISEIIMAIYPTKELEESFNSGTAWKFSCGVAAVFVFTGLVFFVYDVMVKRRQEKVMERIIRQDKIVLNTFPKAIRDKLYKESSRDRDHSRRGSLGSTVGSGNGNSIFGSGQIAELYPSATVVFADIVGFTAWSSAREPNQVFKLLETIYKEFDRLAYRNNVYKVETVGDCYVAVAGVPEQCEDHALAVARFSRDCMHKMPDLVRKLEILLGPDTADLQLRIGLNTGQITAGVLRGEKARFQLFGDTVNTASRMETTSKAGCIHVSSSTADALRKAGREKWLKPRSDTILVKGKGQMQTYYLETIEGSIQRAKLAKYKRSGKTGETTNSFAESVITEEESSDGEDTEHLDGMDEGDLSDDFDIHRNMSKRDRLVEWNVEILSHLLKQILVARPEHQQACNKSTLAKFEKNVRPKERPTTTVLDEFQEIIELPSIGAEELLHRKHPDTITLRPVVVEQLRDLLKEIASMYNENAFHNFEHASHVTASVRKLLTRIVDADHNRSFDSNFQNGQKLVDMSGNSFGITSDPLTQFSVVFSAVIHDAGHPGVPNTQLVKEKTRLAKFYRKSIAEQNSVEIVWGLLMSSAYDDLRSCIYSSENEMKRFRQLVVNTVMATDIMDKELQTLRKMRWEQAFSPNEHLVDVSKPQLDINRKATIVIEHLIQASDVSHTMQHWSIYKKWNERFFFELYDAYKNGRSDKDPSIGWYKGEIGFFDFYVIPLAKKLESCGVFGVSSHEYLSYAQSNREQWEREGEQVVKEFLEAYNKRMVRRESTKKIV